MSETNTQNFKHNTNTRTSCSVHENRLLFIRSLSHFFSFSSIHIQIVRVYVCVVFICRSSCAVYFAVLHVYANNHEYSFYTENVFIVFLLLLLMVAIFVVSIEELLILQETAQRRILLHRMKTLNR